MSSSQISAPGLCLALAEPWRSASEFAGLLVAAPLLMMLPRGDGHSVMVLPGFGATDTSTMLLRQYLDFLGYRSASWSLGRNLGYAMLGEAEERLRARVMKIAEVSGGKISLIGWSLGGVMARHMAREYPEAIRQVITLGAPFTGNPAATTVRRLYEHLSGESFDAPDVQKTWRSQRAPPPVHTTSIYTKTDGITAWQNCLEIETELAENVEVFGSHIGLPHNPMALYAIAKRLARSDQSLCPAPSPS